jgi:hypothetical protein
VGDWEGQDVFFCQNEACQRSFTAAQLQGRDRCRVCQGPLKPAWSLAECGLLPADTTLLRREYRRPSGETLVVSVVVSGGEEVSVHRPQICLVGQGYEIVAQRAVDVGLERGAPLKVMVLELIRRSRQPGGRMAEENSFYAYWFVSARHETPYHLVRIFLTVLDRVVFSRSPRWAYVAVAGLRPAGDGGGRRQELTGGFIAALHSALVLKER